MAVVTVLRPPPQAPRKERIPVPQSRRLWILATLDVMAVAWMAAAGSWLDQTSRLTAVVTLGGHHRLVMLLAAIGFAMLAGLAARTEGFTSAEPADLVLIAVAGMVSVVALAGVLSVVLLVAGSGALIGLVGRLVLH